MTIRPIAVIAFILFAAFSLQGCAQKRIVNNPGTAFDSMGSLEEKISVKTSFWARLVTLGLWRKYSYTALTKKLNHRIEDMARNKYGADAVNNMTYWPAPDSDALVDYLYGRGEMIRFKKFGDEASTVSTTAN